jgi:hypothetical protein
MNFVDDKLWSDHRDIQTQAVISILNGELHWAKHTHGRLDQHGPGWLAGHLREAPDTTDKLRLVDIVVDQLTNSEPTIRAGAVCVFSSFFSCDSSRMVEIFLHNDDLFIEFEYPYRSKYSDIYTAFMVALGNRETSYSNPLLVQFFRSQLLLKGGPEGLVIVMIREPVNRDRSWLIKNAVLLVSKHPKIMAYLFSGLMAREDISDLTGILLGQVDESNLLNSLSERFGSTEKAQRLITDCKR